MGGTGQSEGFDIFRQVMAFSTADSWKRIPHVSYLYEPDVTAFLSFYREKCRTMTRADGTPLRVTLNTVFLKLIAEGLRAAPRLNAFLSYSAFTSRGRLSLQPHVNVTIPWLLEDGTTLSVVFPRVEEKSLAELQDAIDRLGRGIKNSDLREVLSVTALHDTLRRVRSGNPAGIMRVISAALGLNRLPFLRGTSRKSYYGTDASTRLGARDIDAGTVVVSNIGSIRKEGDGKFLLIDVIDPQVFAVGISALQERPGIATGQDGVKTVGIRTVLPLCLVFDHRAFEFSALLPFLERVGRLLADPSLILPLFQGGC
jgi:pyruvate/2-oxoglutarate dehydrogenase complex dihydrolipoamide acyltransferase (E2) component